MKRYLVLGTFITFVFFAKAEKIISVITTPILLQPYQTIIVKADYFPHGYEELRILLPIGLKLINQTKDIIILSGKMARPIDNIRFQSIDTTIDIPCRNSRKIPLNTTIELPKSTKKVGIKGSFNGWALNDTLLQPVGKIPTKTWLISGILANEGYIQYKLVIDGKELNPINATTVSNGLGGTNSIIKVGEPDATAPQAFTENFDSLNIYIRATNATNYLAYFNNQLIAKNSIPISGLIHLIIPEQANESIGRSHIRVYINNRSKIGNDILIPLENGRVITAPQNLKRTDLHTQIMYFMMVDRFANGNTSNDPKQLNEVLPKAQYLGGDLKGIQDKINGGFFDQLGVNTIWLSPITQNPKGAWGLWNKQVTTKFSAYHGYWPISYSKVDSRFGDNQLFTNVISSAHKQNINIVLDFVAHHIHIEHPLYQKHPEWATPLYLPDGTMNTERWDDHRLTTWFDTFLPTLNFENKEVRELVSDSILYWVKNFELDGFRHDASKHVPEEFWRLLTQKIKLETQKKTNPTFYQIGETYGSAELISSYVNSGQMDAQFDFNLYDASINAFITDNNAPQAWQQLQQTLSESFDYYGYHHLMGNISGNQDKPRFASLADGSVKQNEDTKLAGWTKEITNANEKGFTRMAQLMALNMTLPGVPVIYYGDEFAMPGANDPDNRRMMQFGNYTNDQQTLINKVKLLTNLRKQNMALLYGDYKKLDTDKQYFAYERNYFGQKVMVVFSKDAGNVNLPIVATSQKWTEVMGKAFSQTDEYVNIHLKANDVAIFILN